MSRPTRFHAQDVFASQGDVTTYHGLDPLTGLPVLIYRFPGPPGVDVGVLESENIPGILESSISNGEGQLVTAYSPEYRIPRQRATDDLLPLATGAFRALADAADAGLVHGDLRPERFSVLETHLLVEGFGVPWVPETPTFLPPNHSGQASFAADVYSMAVALRVLVRGKLQGELDAALSDCTNADPEARPSAREVLERLENLARGLAEPAHPVQQETGTARSATVTNFDELTLDVSLEATNPPTAAAAQPPTSEPGGEEPELDLDFSETVPFPGSETPPATDLDRVQERAATEPDDAAEPEPLLINTDPGRNEGRKANARSEAPPPEAPPQRAPNRALTRGAENRSDPRDGFIKDLPPGATYRPGESSDRLPPAIIAPEAKPEEREVNPSRRRVILVAAIIVAAAILAILAVVRQRSNRTPIPQASQGVNYILDVVVEPSNLPPVTLVVLESPEGSKLSAGSSLGSVPRKIVLDQPGIWRLQGRFQERISPEVIVTVPEDRLITVEIPVPDPDSP